MRTCIKCGHEKPESEFHGKGRGKKGRMARCKTCFNAASAQYRESNDATVRAKDRKRNSTPERRAAIDAYRLGNPKKWNAKSLLAYHVKTGNVKPQPCLVCGTKAEAHHPDYDAPLDVVWLCRKHHRQTHALAQSLVKELAK